MITRGPYKTAKFPYWAFGTKNNASTTYLTSSQTETNPSIADLTSSDTEKNASSDAVIQKLIGVRFFNNEDQISTSTVEATESTQTTEIHDLTTTLNKLLKGCHKK